ncbi:MAG: acylphosphatase [Acidobacteriota bacterium]|nr:acylphosphatase [Acidobacteriota bacterium]
MSLLCRHCLVSGRVQGVGYRVFVQDAALRQPVSGHVRNLVAGRVERVLSGTRESVERVERLLQLGPVGSRVERVDATEHAAEAFEDAFEIRATTGRTGE